MNLSIPTPTLSHSSSTMPRPQSGGGLIRWCCTVLALTMIGGIAWRWGEQIKEHAIVLIPSVAMPPPFPPCRSIVFDSDPQTMPRLLDPGLLTDQEQDRTARGDLSA